ncbi:hypothetical protein [Pseudomonas sp. Irchel 3E20]|uniref:hypothetical protein n=1 Tax=Pseudomonas sp. Irchel 3E20 TaxID=2008983 RepID=UPI000BA2CC90|nr:hypothetical protein [Pseudomonas sp. Irchel 3E20]
MTDYTELKRLAEAAQYQNHEFQHELVRATTAFFGGCIPEQILELIAERDQLKAENEALRNGLRLARHWCASALKAARVDSQPSELLDIACLLRHQASDIDAAMGKGEQ